MRIAGIAGAHHTFRPKAESDVGPNNRTTDIIALAQATALMKLSPEN